MAARIDVRELPDSRRQAASLPCQGHDHGESAPLLRPVRIVNREKWWERTLRWGSHFFRSSEPAVVHFSGVDMCPDPFFPKQSTSVTLVLGVRGPGGMMEHTEATALVSAYLMATPTDHATQTSMGTRKSHFGDWGRELRL